MEIDFVKEKRTVHDAALDETLSLMLEGEVIVPDVLGDVKEILLTEATAKITKTEEEGERTFLSGLVPVHILYNPDQGGLPCSIDAKLEFKESIAHNLSDFTSVITGAKVEYIECSMVHARKLSVKIGLLITARGYRPRELSWVDASGMEETLAYHTKPVMMYDVVADKQKEFTLSESLEIPRSKPEAETIVRVLVKAEKNDCRLMSGKVLLKGSLMVHILYSARGEEAGLSTMEYEIPFSEIVDVEQLGEDCFCHVAYQVGEVFYALGEDANGKLRSLGLDVCLSARVTVSKSETVVLVDDCYSLQGLETLEKETIVYPEMLCEGTGQIACRETMVLPREAPALHGIYSLDIKPKINRVYMEQDTLIIKGRLCAFLLYGSSEGEDMMNAFVQDFEFSHGIPVEGVDETAVYECEAQAQNVSFVLTGASEVEIRCHLTFYTRALVQKHEEIVAGCTVEEESPEKSRGLIIYFARSGDTLWDVAKRYRRDKDKIMIHNHLEGETLTAGQKLLIPRG